MPDGACANAKELEERPLTHVDLSVEGVGGGQQTFAIDIEAKPVLTDQLHQPRLGVVRVRREHGVREGQCAGVDPLGHAVPTSKNARLRAPSACQGQRQRRETHS